MNQHYLGLILIPLYQGVQSVDAVFNWWYWGLGGLGGWALFLLIGIGANAYIIFDSQARNVPATGWKAAALLPVILILPTLFFRFSAPDTQQSLRNLMETFFFLGIIGGITPLAAAVGYAINYVGYRAQNEPAPAAYAPPPPPVAPRPEPLPSPAPSRPARPHANGWLVDQGSNHSHQLYQGDTRIGRGKQNDIALNDKAVSREHALIREQHGHFTVFDRGSRTGVYLNGQRLQRPEILAHGDTVELGDTRLQFITGK
jgi:hypothetical protein